jgi:hypothetical protein
MIVDNPLASGLLHFRKCAKIKEVKRPLIDVMLIKKIFLFWLAYGLGFGKSFSNKNKNVLLCAKSKYTVIFT